MSEQKWQVKTGSQNVEPAAGSVEIPERQSVASLREQIANKLEVKSPTSIEAAAKITFNPLSPAAVRNGDAKLNSAPTSPEHAVAEMPQLKPAEEGRSEKPLLVNITPHGLHQIVHEPMKRHVSRITPVPFCRPTLSFSSLNTTEYDNTSFTQPNYTSTITEKTLLSPEAKFADRSKRAASEFTIRNTLNSDDVTPMYATLSRTHEVVRPIFKEADDFVVKTDAVKPSGVNEGLNSQVNEPSCSNDYRFNISNNAVSPSLDQKREDTKALKENNEQATVTSATANESQSQKGFVFNVVTWFSRLNEF